MHDYYAKGLPGNLPLINDAGFEKLKNGGIGVELKGSNASSILSRVI